MSIVSESNPWCDITSAENALGMDSQPFTTASPLAQISFSLFALTCGLPSAGPVSVGPRQAESYDNSEGDFVNSEGDFVPLPTVVARLAPRSSLPPPGPEVGLRGRSPRSERAVGRSGGPS